MRLAAISAIALALLLAGCSGKTRHAHAPGQTGAGPSYSGGGSAPLGQGGYRKTGTPYQVNGRWYYPMNTAYGYDQTGTASWYGREFHGKKTANGERYDMHAMSAAHTTLPMPSMVRVTNLDNGRSVVVRVNDRGPFVKSRIIDLSYAAAKALGYDKVGTARVRVQALEGSKGNASEVAQSARKIQPVAYATPSQAPTPRNGGMYIQLGAFSSRNNADRLMNELKISYPSVNIYTGNGGYSEIYRVRIGPFEDVKSIESNVLSLQGRGYSNAIVVIE